MSKAMFTGHAVEVKNLEETLNWLAHVDPKMQKALKKGLKEAMSPVLEKARANARKIQDDGTYSESLSVAQRKSGVEWVLKSTDPQAGVKEFAKPGAVVVRSRTNSKRSRTMLALHSRIGVPRGLPPRVMVPAVEASENEVRDRIDAAMAEVLNEVGRDNG